jgi:hypothetical protein
MKLSYEDIIAADSSSVTFAIGKHQGRRVCDVFRSDRWYCGWFLLSYVGDPRRLEIYSIAKLHLEAGGHLAVDDWGNLQ